MSPSNYQVMKYLGHLAVIVFLLSLQQGLFVYMPVFGGLPNLLLVWVIICSLLLEGGELFFVCAVSGLFLDFYTPAFAGSFVLAFLLAASAVRLLSRRIVALAMNWKLLSLAVVFGALFAAALVWLYAKAVFHLGWWPLAGIDAKRFWIQLAAQTGYNLAVLAPLYKLAIFMQNFFHKPR